MRLIRSICGCSDLHGQLIPRIILVTAGCIRLVVLVDDWVSGYYLDKYLLLVNHKIIHYGDVYV